MAQAGRTGQSVLVRNMQRLIGVIYVFVFVLFCFVVVVVVVVQFVDFCQFC